MEIDLHGIKHEDDKQTLDKAIWECMKKKKHRLWVITGNSDDMKKIVHDVIKEYRLTAVESMFNPAETIIELI
jgi:DNA-nicking Smr family endonuclease